MRVTLALNDFQKFILHVLAQTEPISLTELHQVISGVLRAGSGMSHLIRVVAAAHKRRDPFHYLHEPISKTRPAQSPYIASIVEGLIHIGLVASSSGTLLRQQKSLLDFPFFDDPTSQATLALTGQGKRVAMSIQDDRRLILPAALPSRATVFIASAFGHKELDVLHAQVLAPACESLGFKPIRIDMTEPTQTITQAILQGITESACVIADLTYARPSVYFEAGIAHGLGVPLLLTCRADHHRGKQSTQKVHFDLEQYKISFWTRTSTHGFRWPRQMEPSARLPHLLPKLPASPLKRAPSAHNNPSAGPTTPSISSGKLTATSSPPGT